MWCLENRFCGFHDQPATNEIVLRAARASLVMRRAVHLYLFGGASNFLPTLSRGYPRPVLSRWWRGAAVGIGIIGPGAVIINVMDQIMTSIGHESRAPFLKELTALQPCKEGR